MQPVTAGIDKDALKLVENEPLLVGYTDALKQVLDETKKRVDEISREKMPCEQGKEAACRDLAARVLGLVSGIKEQADAGNIPLDEAMARRDLVVKACSLIEVYAKEARTEYLHLQGEHRAAMRQIDIVSKLLTTRIADEARKARSAAERERQREERTRREFEEQQANAAAEQAGVGAEPAQETMAAGETCEASSVPLEASAGDFGDEELEVPNLTAEPEPEPEPEPGPLPEPAPIIQITGRRRRSPKKR